MNDLNRHEKRLSLPGIANSPSNQAYIGFWQVAGHDLDQAALPFFAGQFGA